MSDIITERSASILRIQLNRPTMKNAMTSSMYLILADLLNSAATDDQIRVQAGWYRFIQPMKLTRSCRWK